MDLNYTAAARFWGIAIAIFGGMMLFPAFTALIYHEYSCLVVFLITGAACALIGAVIAILCKPSQHRLMVREGFLIVSVFYLLYSLIGAVPILACGAASSLTDAFFESVSGITSTGATIIEYPEAASRSVIFWRCFMQWLGSFSAITFSMVLFSNLGLSGSDIASIESPVPRLRELTPTLRNLGSFLILFYTIATVLAIMLLRIGDVGRFDSIIYAMSSISNGGFGSRSDSAASIISDSGNGFYVRTVLMLFMLAGSFSFALYYKAFREKIRVIFKDEEVRCFLAIICVSALLISLNLVFFKQHKIYGAQAADMNPLNALFQVVSIITTTGMTGCGFTIWPTFSKLILLGLMLIGACSLSTGGGMKCARIMIALKYVNRGISVRLHPNAVVPTKLSERTLAGDTVSSVLNFILLYFAVVFIGTVLISLDGCSFVQGLSSVISCLGNVGPAFNIGGSELLYASFSPFGKLLLSVLMLAGRLEIFALFMLCSHRFWNPNW